jgi:hypothetical protein
MCCISKFMLRKNNSQTILSLSIYSKTTTTVTLSLSLFEQVNDHFTTTVSRKDAKLTGDTDVGEEDEADDKKLDENAQIEWKICSLAGKKAKSDLDKENKMKSEENDEEEEEDSADDVEDANVEVS